MSDSRFVCPVIARPRANRTTKRGIARRHSRPGLHERAPLGGGAFAPVAQVAARGPSLYQVVDGSVRAATSYVWRLSCLVTSGAATALATTSATTQLGFPAPPNVLTVGAGGLGTIQVAINAATLPGSVILVRPGTYAAFSSTACRPVACASSATPPGSSRSTPRADR